MATSSRAVNPIPMPLHIQNRPGDSLRQARLEQAIGGRGQRQPVLVSLNTWQVEFGLQHPRM